MSLELREPVLVIGLGGAGSRIATRAAESLGTDCLLISNDQADLKAEQTIKIPTGNILNPSSQTIRGFAMENVGQIKQHILKYSSIVMMANLAGRAGSAIAPIVSAACKEEEKNLVSFAVMPFGYENDRMFSSGVSLRRVKEDSACTVIIDNDAMLASNPDLTVKACYETANSAIQYMVESLKSSGIPSGSSMLSAGRDDDIEVSLRDSLKMLYENSPPDKVKSSIIHVLGNNIPVGIIKTVSDITQDIIGESSLHATESDEAGVIMLSKVTGHTKFDDYDPLGMIPEKIDWDIPDCSYDCKIDMYQLE